MTARGTGRVLQPVLEHGSGKGRSCSSSMPLLSATSASLPVSPTLQESVPLGKAYDHYPSLFPSHFALKK